LAHGLEHDRFVGARRKTCSSGVTVERVWAAQPGQINRQILGEHNFIFAVRYHRPALRQIDPPGPVEQHVGSGDVQDSLVLFLADLAQVTIAGQDLGTGHRRQPWRRHRADGRLSREQMRRQPGE
jgi:hypothetical protein